MFRFLPSDYRSPCVTDPHQSHLRPHPPRVYPDWALWPLSIHSHSIHLRHHHALVADFPIDLWWYHWFGHFTVILDSITSQHLRYFLTVCARSAKCFLWILWEIDFSSQTASMLVNSAGSKLGSALQSCSLMSGTRVKFAWFVVWLRNSVTITTLTTAKTIGLSYLNANFRVLIIVLASPLASFDEHFPVFATLKIYSLLLDAHFN